MNTRSIKESELIEKWYMIDAKGKRLGKLAVKISAILAGKNDVNQVSYLTPKNKIIVLNTKDVDIHPRKMINKEYFRHSGYLGGLKRTPIAEVKEKRPNEVVRMAVNGMLPKTKQRAVLLANLFLYEGDVHKHDAQKPTTIEL